MSVFRLQGVRLNLNVVKRPKHGDPKRCLFALRDDRPLTALCSTQV